MGFTDVGGGAGGVDRSEEKEALGAVVMCGSEVSVYHRRGLWGREVVLYCWLLDQLRLGDGSHSRRLGRSLIYRRMGLS